MTHFILLVYDYFAKHKGQLFVLLSLLVILFVGMTIHVRFKEDISGFLPEDKKNERINNAYRYVASANKITIFCSATDSTDQAAEAQIKAVDLLAGYLQHELDSTYLKSLLFKIDPAEMIEITSFIVNNMPYFLDEADYQRMDTLLTNESITNQLKNNKELLLSPIGMVIKQNILSDPLRITNPIMARLQEFRIGDQFELYQDHIFTEDHKALLLVECTMPVSETDRNAEFMDSLSQFISKVEQIMEGKITFQSFGASEIALSNASQIKKDTFFSSILSLILIFVLLIYSFRSGRKILLIFISTLFGGLFAMAFLYLIRGEVSVIAVGISSIMFGIAINYPLHFIDHYNHVPHPRLVIKDIIEPLTIGNITTVGAFLSLVFIGSNAMCDLGWFASLLLIGTIIFVLIFLPHLLPSHKMVHKAQPSFISRIVGIPFEKKRWVVTIVILLTLFLSFFSTDTRFETNMQKINYMTENQQKEYQRMMQLLNKNQHILYYVTEGDNLNNALQANEDLAPHLNTLINEGKIAKVSGVGNFYPSLMKQTERINRWNAFWTTRKNAVLTALNEESQKLGFKPNAFQSFEEMLDQTWEVADLSYFNPIKESLVKNYIFENGQKTMILNLLHTDVADVPKLEEELNLFSPSSIAFDAGSLTRRMIASLSENFNYVLYVCGCIVFAFLIFSMGRIELSIIAFTPLALSWVWILGLMNIFDIRFNIVNIILATFIFGQGDDYTIFMTEGLMYEYTYRRKILTSYKNSIALSALIMFIGIGTLIFAKHPALRSLAEVTIIGMLSVVLMSYLFPSLLFHALTLRKGKKRIMPVTLKNLSVTIFALIYFLFTNAIITIIGWGLFTLGKSTERKKRFYHKLLHTISRFVIFHIPQVETTFKNQSDETFEKPSIIICNHQSHIDLMSVMMLTPKLVILTNNWVWNSPFYGQLIKYADFLPVTDSIEKTLEQLRKVVQQGYSIVVFPEGTRSEDCSILRFHRGAFFLAQQMQLDIVPVIIHGVGHVLPKQEFMLRKGKIHIQVMERIKTNDTRFSNEYSPRSKEVRRFYKERYQALCEQIETPGYYADLVIHNYIYKGPSVERKVRRNFRKHQNYTSLINQLPDKGKIRVINSGYGEFTLLLALVKKQLQITAIEKNPDLRDLAANCASVPANLLYAEDEPIFTQDRIDLQITIENDTYSIESPD